MFQEHHEEDLFLYMTYSNESVYGAWGRTKDWRKRREETKWDCRRNEELRLFVMFHTTIILYDIVLISNYSTCWKKGFAKRWGIFGRVLPLSVFWVLSILQFYYTSSYVDSLHGERRGRLKRERENAYFRKLLEFVLRELSVSFSVICI